MAARVVPQRAEAPGEGGENRVPHLEGGTQRIRECDHRSIIGAFEEVAEPNSPTAICGMRFTPVRGFQGWGAGRKPMPARKGQRPRVMITR